MIPLKDIPAILTEKSECSQAFSRSILLIAVTIFFFITTSPVFFTALGVTISSILWMYWTIKIPVITIRKRIGIVIDQFYISSALWMMGPSDVSVILIYFWVMLGSGYRYGSYYALIASGASVSFLALTVTFAPLWQGFTSYGFELVVGHILVSIFAFKIFNNLEHAIEEASTARREADVAENKALTDSLTGLYNREYGLNWLEQANKNNQHIGVLFIDLDNFKQFNDTYGHLVGDDVLINISRRLKNCVRPQDVVCRYAGDEFIILINDGSHKTVDEVANRIRSTLDTQMHIGDIDLLVTGSIGVAILGVHGTEVEEVLQHADTAMYVAKHIGRNQVAWYDEEIKREYAR